MMRNEPLQPVVVEEPFQLTREEQEFIRKCLSNKLWRNELPWSFATGFLVKMAMQAGYIKHSKVTLFSTVLGAFVFSRALSYGNCFQKLVQQPGNTVGERLNQKKRIIYNQPADRHPAYPGEPESIYTQPNYLDVDIDKPDYPGIDPAVPSPNETDAMPLPRPGQTYAELRRQNREAYQQQFRGARPQAPHTPPTPTPERPPGLGSPLGQPSPSSPYERTSYSFDSAVGSYDRPTIAEEERSTAPTPPQYEQPRTPPYDGRTSSRRTQTNKYGDIWDE